MKGKINKRNSGTERNGAEKERIKATATEKSELNGWERKKERKRKER
jgi:hypothetical protein